MIYKKYKFVRVIIYFFIAQCQKDSFVVAIQCPNTTYRSFDGSCNNLRDPDWGTASTAFRRLLPPIYADGIRSYRKSISGSDLPNARKISEKMYPEKDIQDSKFTLGFMQYGQFITHDMAIISTDGSQFLCCSEDLQFLDDPPSPKCDPIVIPKDDSYYSKKNAECISFARVFTEKDRGCGDDTTPDEQLTAVNAYLDLSIVYGDQTNTNDYMRLNKDGLLKTRKDDRQEWPLKTLEPATYCYLSRENETCFYPSDTRLNQNPQLTLLHIIYYREHNRLAKDLAKVNPHWDDNTLFEEARKINIAQHQWISYYEWLPLLLNRDSLLNEKIIYAHPTNFINTYKPCVDASVLTEHNNAAFRIHTLIAGHLNLVEEDRRHDTSLRLSDWYLQPYVLEKGHHFSQLTRGLATQPCLASNQYHDPEITHFWFKRGNLGYDLKAIDIQRGRDVGLPTYNKMRAFCNLPQAESFDEFTDIPTNILQDLSKLYESPNDVDLIVGGSLESLMPGALVGPTFHCILLEQFKRTRLGDRFWFESSGNVGFTLEQLNEIRNKTRLSRLFCDNTVGIHKMQLKAFEKISVNNPLEPCESLPRINISIWKNYQSSSSSVSST